MEEQKIVSERYFNDTTFIFKLLRFMNLMEPGRAVISLTKLFLLTTIVALGVVMTTDPSNIAAVIGSASSAIVGVGAYIIRRQQNKDVSVVEIVPSEEDQEGVLDWIGQDPSPDEQDTDSHLIVEN